MYIYLLELKDSNWSYVSISNISCNTANFKHHLCVTLIVRINWKKDEKKKIKKIAALTFLFITIFPIEFWIFILFFKTSSTLLFANHYFFFLFLFYTFFIREYKNLPSDFPSVYSILLLKKCLVLNRWKEMKKIERRKRCKYKFKFSLRKTQNFRILVGIESVFSLKQLNSFFFP